MSDKPDEEYSEKKLEVTIKKSQKDADEKSQLEAQNRELKTENADIKSQLETIADMEFVRQKEQVITRGRKVGLTINPESILEPENLVSYAQIVKQREAEDKILNKGQPAGSGVALTGAQTGEDVPDQSDKPLREREYANLDQLMADLEKERQIGNPEATAIVSKLTKKSLKRDFEAEFVGDLPKSVGNNDEAEKEKKKWREIQ